MEELSSSISELAMSLNNVWVLFSAFLVMFMQAGFALVEVGFTQSKNGVNIIMKNLVDFLIGSIVFWAVGYSLMFGEDVNGLFGQITFLYGPDEVDGLPQLTKLMFQTVFAATSATIVSGAMAERTVFSAYLIYSFFISLVIYPISGHWIWGGGWLSEMGFIDFAGSTVVHSVGGWVSLVGAALLGPRTGKYINGKAQVIPPQNLILGSLGVFVLWLGWFGFNPGSQLAAAGTDNALAIAHIAVNTNLAAAAGALAAMLVSYLRNKKWSLSLTLNGALAGLVGVTAGCAVVSLEGAFMIGIICGITLVFAIDFVEKVLKIDDPVGAISVHGISGALGTLLVGVFAVDGGSLYGGGLHQLYIQAIGIFAVMAWAGGSSFLLFKTMKVFNNFRVSKEIELEGLDMHEHGEVAYN
jgi:Amt family ammonium transporter